MSFGSCGDNREAGAERLGNQRVSGFWARYVSVLLWLGGVKYVSSYRDGVRKMNVWAKDLMFDLLLNLFYILA